MSDLARILAAPDPPAAALAEAVLRHDGRIFQKQRRRIAALLRAEAERRDPGLAAPVEAAFLRSCTIHPALLALLLPPAAGAFLPEAEPPGRARLLPPGPNELHEPDILRRFRAAGGTAVATTLSAPARPEFALLGLLRRFLATLPGEPEPGPPLRLFVSRRDALKRRLVNEAEILPVLAPLGFRPVALAELPLPRQFALMRAAEAVIGPHGAGFTHLALHPGAPRLGEVLHPEGASSLAYRTLVRALGGVHRFLVGTPAPGRFDLTVAPQAMAALAEALLSETGQAGG
jgi:hypothetical protein